MANDRASDQRLFDGSSVKQVPSRRIWFDRITDAAQWSYWLAQVPVSYNVWQNYSYAEAKAVHEGWEPVRFAIQRGSQVVAICQVLEYRKAGIKLASRVRQGPLFLQVDPPSELLLEVYRALRVQCNRPWTGPLLLEPALTNTPEHHAILRLAGYKGRPKQYPWCSGLLDLNRSEDEIFAGFSSTFRNRYRKAEKAGLGLELSTDPAVIDWLIERNAAHLAQFGVNCHTAVFYHTMLEHDSKGLYVLRALHQGEAVGGTIVVHTGNTAKYEVGWHSPDLRDLNLGNFLMWHAIREAKRRGAHNYDIGGLGSSDSGFTHFKRKMQAPEYTLIGEYYTHQAMHPFVR